MSLASRVRGFGAKAEQPGIALDERQSWCVGPSSDVKRLVRALPLLSPDGGVVYFEGTSDPRVAAFLGRFVIEPTVQLAAPAVWPRPDFYHVPITGELMDALARFVEESEVGRFCTHLYVYRETSVLLQGRNAFVGFPLYLSRSLPEPVVRAFATAIGSIVR